MVTAPESTLSRVYRPLATVIGRSSEPKPGPSPELDFFVTARKRFALAEAASQEYRRKALEDLEFYIGNQWPAEILNARNIQNRPCLTINKLAERVSLVANQQRQARPSIQINPVGSGADVDTAQIIQGLIRHIEINSGADLAYDTAFEYAVTGGFGWFRILTGWEGIDSLNQDIFIEPVRDPFSVYCDPAAKHITRRDMKWAFVVEDIDRDLFREMHPDTEAASLADFRGIGDSERQWYPSGSIRVAEYFRIETVNRVLVGLANGHAKFEDDLDEYDQIAKTSAGMPVIRRVPVPVVQWCKMTSRDILQKRTVPGLYIPLIPVLGKELIVDGKLVLEGLVRHAKDAQRNYNYNRSAITEATALAPKAPWMVAEGQIEGYEDLYERANSEPIGVLYYRPKAFGDQLAPPPNRVTAEPPIQALSQSLTQSEHDIDSTTTVYPNMLAAPAPESSGRAILARQNQGEVKNFNFQDNLHRAIAHAGKIILGMIPKIYDAARTVRIVKPDQTHELVRINEMFSKDGGWKVYDLTIGRYDVTISADGNFSSRRQEFVQSVMQLVTAAPQLMQFVMDLLVRNMDWPGAQEIADRLNKLIPPQLRDSGPDEGENLQALKQKLGQVLQQNAMLIQQLEKASDVIEKKKLEGDLKERLALLDAQTKIIVAELGNKSAEGQMLARLDYQAIAHQLDLVRAQQEQDLQSALNPQQAQPPQPQAMTPPAGPQVQ